MSQNDTGSNICHQNVLSVMTYNMHGYNQGESLVKEVCNNNSYALIYLQEHWLTPGNMHKFDIFTNYTCFGVSAMDSTIKNNILVGRPFGGVLTMINNSLLSHTIPLLIKERLIILRIHDYIFINTYFPCKDNSHEYKDILYEILADISSTIDDINYRGIIFGGDLNNNLQNNSEMSCVIKTFLAMYGMEFIDIMMYNSSEVYTFSNSAKGCHSIIDYICVSSSMLQSIVKYDVVCSAYNFSDHEPVEIKLNISLLSNTGAHAGTADRPSTAAGQASQRSNNNPTARRFRFDHGNVNGYYDYTRVLIEPLYNEISQVCTNLDYNRDINELCNCYDIERWYNGIVHALLQASHETLPYTDSNMYKHWWSESLNVFKQDCMKSHQAWVDVGKPRAGPIFQKRNEDKRKYRDMIKLQKLNSKQALSDSLLISLYNGDSKKFWEIWKKKVCERSRTLPNIAGAVSESTACDMFKTHFSNVCNSVDPSFDANMSLKVQELILQKSNACSHNVGMKRDLKLFNATVIDIAISKIDYGKSIGIDGLQKEHLVNAHPILYVALSKLFSLMYAVGYVPNEFGRGIIVPLLKDTTLKGAQNIDNFRGITISSLLSKVFEHSMIFLFGKLLTTNERQFGFKEKLGCNDAIFCVRNVIDYFVDNGSTVSICCLDVSKAFDRLNHNCLFYKLLKKNVPFYFIKVLINWYSKLYANIRWGNTLSQQIAISCGIRQGGVLSPVLFCVYVDNILNSLSNYGCRMHSLSYGSYMYADDLILIAPTVAELQTMINVCCNELEAINLKLNTKKSCCLRIGKNHFAKCVSIPTAYGSIPWVKEAKYLGLTLVSGSRFKISFASTKCKFYACFNELYSKLGRILDQSVIVHLLQTMAMPILTYSLESLSLNKSELSNLEFTLNRALFKIFKVSSTENMQVCKYAYGIDGIAETTAKKKSKFYLKLNCSDNMYLKTLIPGLCLRPT